MNGRREGRKLASFGFAAQHQAPRFSEDEINTADSNPCQETLVAECLLVVGSTCAAQTFRPYRNGISAASQFFRQPDLTEQRITSDDNASGLRFFNYSPEDSIQFHSCRCAMSGA